MALTRDFRETVMARAGTDSEFRRGLLTEALDLLMSGDVDSGKAVLRTYINATVGFEVLAAETGIPSKSLMRMFSDKGNPRADNLFKVISALQELTEIHLQVKAA